MYSLSSWRWVLFCYQWDWSFKEIEQNNEKAGLGLAMAVRVVLILLPVLEIPPILKKMVCKKMILSTELIQYTFLARNPVTS